MCIVPKRESSDPPPTDDESDSKPPRAPRNTDPNIRRSRTNARLLAARSTGRDNTLLTGELVSSPRNQPAKTVLGA